jgi:putative copper resistance protein D
MDRLEARMDRAREAAWRARLKAGARRAVGPVVGLALVLTSVGDVSGHGPAPADPPSLPSLLGVWSFEPALMLPLVASALLWLALVRHVNLAHPARPVPRARSAAFLVGLFVIAVALQSGIELYDTTLFSVHMVQHLLLTLVAAPLLVLGAPVTLLLRAAAPAVRRRLILPALHSPALRVAGHPLLATVLFAAVMWGTHFSPLFDEALENRLVHDLEHIAFIATAVLFWWPAVGVDPGPYRLSHPARILYTFLQMPQNTFLAVAITFAPAPLYPHYATLTRSWGPDALTDQQLAGAIMWVGGDLIFLGAILALVVAWSRQEERDTAGAERRADAARAALRAREAAFAARRATAEVGEGSRTGAALPGGPAAQAGAGRTAGAESPRAETPGRPR